MASVRRKKSQKKKRMTSTTTGRKLKKKNKPKLHIENKAIRDAWDKRKSVKKNFIDMGLSYDTNMMVKKKEKDIETMDVDKSNVVEKLELEASNISKSEKHIPPGEARFLWTLINDHGENYQAMVRDKRNYNQLTACQLKRKCVRFLSSSQDFSQYLNS